jgi:hypothetical protein
MPYTKDSKLPSYVASLSDELKAKWISIFNAAFDKYGETKAFLIANTWLKKEMQPRKELIKRSVIVFTGVPQRNSLIKRSSDGEDYVTLVLASTQPHLDNTRFSSDLLRKWAEQINSAPKMIGGADFDHQLYDKYSESDMTDDQVRYALRMKPGIAKAVKAVFKDGQLWVRAMIDKRYKAIINKSRGVSAEAVISKWNGSDALDGDLLGFTFNVHTTPADSLARVVE